MYKICKIKAHVKNKAKNQLTNDQKFIGPPGRDGIREFTNILIIYLILNFKQLFNQIKFSRFGRRAWTFR